MDFDTVAELLGICRKLLLLVEAQERALRQLGALTDAEGTGELKVRLRALQEVYGPFENGGTET